MNVVVLAGDRGPDDPLASQGGVPGKTLVPVAGIPMLTRVLRTLTSWAPVQHIGLVVPPGAAYQSAIDRAEVSQPIVQIPAESSPSLSVTSALEALGSARPVTLVTADHPLLKTEWLDELSEPGDDDLRVGLVDHAGVRIRFPESRRTRYRFSDRDVGGTNLFQFRTSAADQILELWRTVEQERKRPWKIVSLLGARNLLRYAAGRLSSQQAFDALSQRLGFKVGFSLINDPVSAVDIDNASDLALVESVLSEGAAS